MDTGEVIKLRKRKNGICNLGVNLKFNLQMLDITFINSYCYETGCIKYYQMCVIIKHEQSFTILKVNTNR